MPTSLPGGQRSHCLPSGRYVNDTPHPRTRVDLTDLQAFPELQLRIPSPQDSVARTPSATTSPTTVAAAATPPDYTHSPNSNPNKRRRYSIDDEGSERASRVPRLYHARQPSPAQRTPAESWAGSAKTSPFMNGAMQVHSPPTVHLPERPVERLERRPNFPAIVPPHAVYEREQPVLRAKASIEDYPVPRAAPLEAPHHTYRHPFAYHPFHHPSRMQSLSVGSAHPFERERYYVPAYGPAHYHPDFVRYGDVGHGGDTRQRKRRGNLPKETTDKLRAWFVAHLHHPYPTEDEKQELMRQTGLQMSECTPLTYHVSEKRKEAIANREKYRPNLKLVHQCEEEAAPHDDQQCPCRVRRAARLARGEGDDRVRQGGPADASERGGVV